MFRTSKALKETHFYPGQ